MIIYQAGSGFLEGVPATIINRGCNVEIVPVDKISNVVLYNDFGDVIEAKHWLKISEESVIVRPLPKSWRVVIE